MGPIFDQWGLEQGGINSSEFYKIYNNDQIKDAQDTTLGVSITDPHVISAIAQADDIALLSDDIFSLNNLLSLTLSYCKKNFVQLCPGKTKLQAYSNNATDDVTFYAKAVSPIQIDGEHIKFENKVKHVGVTRSTSGNLSHILDRFTAHRRALAAVLPVGLAKGHRASPAAALRIHQLYATPVLLS